MWLSQVEIEHYSVVYFARITAFEALQLRTSMQCWAHTCCRCSWIYAADMNPVLKRSSVLQHFKCGNVIKIRNGIMFDLPGTPTYIVCMYIVLDYMCMFTWFLIYTRMDRLVLLTAEESRVNMEDVKLVTIETISNQFFQPSEQKAREEGKEPSTGDADLATEPSEKAPAVSPSGQSEAVKASAVDSQTDSLAVQQSEGTTAKDVAAEVEGGGGGGVAREGEKAPVVFSPTGSSSKEEKEQKSNDDPNDGVPQKDKATSNKTDEDKNEESTKTSATLASGTPFALQTGGTSKTAVVMQGSPSPETVELTENLKQSQAQVSALLVAAKGTTQPQTYVVPVPVVTHVPVVKSGPKPSINIQKEREKIAIMSAEKLKVGQVEMLSGHEPKPVEICSAVQETMDRNAVTIARSPQVAVISPMLSRETVEGKSGSTEGDGSVKKQADAVVIDLSREGEDGRKSSECEFVAWGRRSREEQWEERRGRGEGR